MFARFCAFLRVFSGQNGLQIMRKFAHNRAKMCKKRFSAIPPLAIPPFACHRDLQSQSQNRRNEPQINVLGSPNRRSKSCELWFEPVSSGAWRGAPDGVATLKVRKGAFDALNKGSGALEKWSKVVAPSGAPPEELYDCVQIAFRIAMPISCTISQYNGLFWDGSHCLKSMVICDSQFESQITLYRRCAWTV